MAAIAITAESRDKLRKFLEGLIMKKLNESDKALVDAWNGIATGQLAHKQESVIQSENGQTSACLLGWALIKRAGEVGRVSALMPMITDSPISPEGYFIGECGFSHMTGKRLFNKFAEPVDQYKIMVELYGSDNVEPYQSR